MAKVNQQISEGWRRARPAASSRWDERARALRRSGGTRGLGQVDPGEAAGGADARAPAWIRSWCGSRAAPGPARSPGRRCSIPSTRSGPLAELFLYLAARAELVADGHRAGARGGTGGALRPVRALDRGVPDGRSGHSRPRWCSRPTGRRRAGLDAGPDADPRPAARGRPGPAGGGGEAARPARRGRAPSSIAGWSTTTWRSEGDGVRHLDGRFRRTGSCRRPGRKSLRAASETFGGGNRLSLNSNRRRSRRSWPTRRRSAILRERRQV